MNFTRGNRYLNRGRKGYSNSGRRGYKNARNYNKSRIETTNDPKKGMCIHLIVPFSKELDGISANEKSLLQIQSLFNIKSECKNLRCRCPDSRKSHEIIPNDDSYRKQLEFMYGKHDKSKFQIVFDKLKDLFIIHSDFLKSKFEIMCNTNFDRNNLIIPIWKSEIRGYPYWESKIEFSKSFLENYTESNSNQLGDVFVDMINIWRLVEGYLCENKSEKKLFEIMNFKNREESLLWSIYPFINVCIIQEFYLQYLDKGKSLYKELSINKPINGKSKNEWEMIVNFVKDGKLPPEKGMCVFSNSICNRGYNSLCKGDSSKQICMDFLCLGQCDCLDKLFFKLDKTKDNYIDSTSRNFMLLPLKNIRYSQEIVSKARELLKEIKSKTNKDLPESVFLSPYQNKGYNEWDEILKNSHKVKMDYENIWSQVYNRFFLNYNTVSKKYKKYLKSGKDKKKLILYKCSLQFYKFFAISNNLNRIHLNTNFCLKDLMITKEKETVVLNEFAKAELKKMEQSKMEQSKIKQNDLKKKTVSDSDSDSDDDDF